MLQVPHFETDKYQCNNTFLADVEYGRALDTLVKGACTPCTRQENMLKAALLNCSHVAAYTK